jgi:CRISPR/Cas system-associated exonuclease Cas4 (RecB family)
VDARAEVQRMSTFTILGFDKQHDGKPFKQIDAWSYSRLSDYETCPAKFAYKYIIKLPDVPSPAMARGNEIHKIADAYVNAVIPEEMPPELVKFGDLFRMVRNDNIGVFTEQQWAFAEDWSVTGWFARAGAKAPWVRNIVDLGIDHGDGHITLVDHKTGKMYETNEEQIEQFAMSALLRFSHAQTVEARLWYLDSGDEITRNYVRADLPKLKAKWKLRTEPMFADETFAPRKNVKCRFCPFSKYQGGPCKVA